MHNLSLTLKCAKKTLAKVFLKCVGAVRDSTITTRCSCGLTNKYLQWKERAKEASHDESQVTKCSTATHSGNDTNKTNMYMTKKLS